MLIWLTLVCAVAVTACAPTATRISPTPMVLPTPPPFAAAAPEVALPALVVAERQAANERNLPLLAVLWAQDSRVADSRNTPDPSDDYVWEGHAGLMDRYVVAVFPHPPQPFAALPALEIILDGDEASAQNGQDLWRFVRQDGRWLLKELVIEPAQ